MCCAALWVTYKLAVHRAIFCPMLRHQNTDTTARDVTATCNHAHLCHGLDYRPSVRPSVHSYGLAVSETRIRYKGQVGDCRQNVLKCACTVHCLGCTTYLTLVAVMCIRQRVWERTIILPNSYDLAISEKRIRYKGQVGDCQNVLKRAHTTNLTLVARTRLPQYKQGWFKEL